MTVSVFARLAQASAAPAMLLRAAIVGVNFTIMLGLATLLGLEAFGRLAVLWGLALVISSVIAVGAPLLLLRALSDGGRMTISAVACHLLLYPVGIVLVGLVAFPALAAGLPWLTIALTAMGIHLVTAIANIMRALGSVHGSMALRDAGPQLALGVGALAVADAADILFATASVLFLVAALAMLWCRLHRRWAEIVHPTGRKATLPLGLWWTSVLGMALSQIDIVIGGAYLSDGQIGLYALLRRITNLVVLPVSVATWVTSVPVAAAHGKGDQIALAQASADGSRIALIPGLILGASALVALALMQLPGFRAWGEEADMVFLILLTGAVLQTGFAATFTVATLCGLAHFAALSRLGSITAYVIIVGLMPLFTPVLNALAYTVVMVLGSAGLWAAVFWRLQVDTSAIALVRARFAKGGVP